MKITILILLFSSFFFQNVFAGGKSGEKTVLQETVTVTDTVLEKEEKCEWIESPMTTIVATPVVNYPILVPVACDSFMLPVNGDIHKNNFSSGRRLSKVCK